MTPEQVFKVRYERLRELLKGPLSESAALDVSMILRQMLIDGDNLVDIVNRKYGLKLRFRFVDGPDAVKFVREFNRLGQNPDDPGATMQVLWIGKRPRLRERVVKKDALLKTECLYVLGKWYTVRDIVKMTAIRLGGVHVGEPETDSTDEATLRAINTAIVVEGLPALLRHMMFFGSAVLDGLEPLYNRVCLAG